MAFVTTLLKRELVFGQIKEVWSWTADGVATGVVSPDTNDAEGIGKIREIDLFSWSVTATDTVAVMTYTSNLSRASVTVTCTAGSTGIMTLVGNAS